MKTMALEDKLNPNNITEEQLKKLHRAKDLQPSAAGYISYATLESFLKNPNQCLDGFPVSYDQSPGHLHLLEETLSHSPYNAFFFFMRDHGREFTPENFPLAGNGIRNVNLRIEPYLRGESDTAAIKRLEAAGYTLANVGDGIAFLCQYPHVVQRWILIKILNKDSLWKNKRGITRHPWFFNNEDKIHGKDYHFGLTNFDRDYKNTCKRCGILVECKNQGT